MTSAGLSGDDASIDLTQLIGKLWRRKLWIALAMAAGALLSLVVVRLIEPTYTVELRITSAALAGDISSNIGGISSLAAAAGISIDRTSGATPFDLYLEKLRSRELARTLAADRRVLRTIFANEWNSAAQRWEAPDGIIRSAKAVVLDLLGAPPQPWAVPDATRLQQFLAREVIIVRGTKDPVTRIVIEYKDPEFGRYLLDRMNRIADATVRAQNLGRARENARYLAIKLPSVLILEQRQALVSILSEQEKSIMTASTPLPFAAIPVDTINASDRPTKPAGLVLLAAFIAGGFIVGVVVALVDWSMLMTAARRRNAQ